MAMDDSFDMIVIGAGPAREKAAVQAAYFGKRVAVVDRAANPGGIGGAERRGPRADPARDGQLPHRLSQPTQRRAEPAAPSLSDP